MAEVTMLACLWLVEAAFARRPAPPPPEEVAATLIGRALLSSEPYDELAVLSDDIGHRLAGSAALDRAIAWGVRNMEADGLVNVHTEPVTVPVWIRGEERGEVLAPAPRRLDLLALGGSIGTPPEGITGEVLVVGSFEELELRKDEVAGKIVLFDVPFTTYGETVQYRGGGASAAARHGAVAALVRSVTPVSLGTPHTGGMSYADERRIPAAAITVEDATQIHRQVDRGQTVTVKLVLGARTAPDALSANVVGEVRGRERPDEIVVLGCHLDSWDVGQGAQDDGAGCVTVMAAADLIARLPVQPRRTVRVVLFTNEENGLMGGRTYALEHQAKEKHIAALEVDTGAGQPLGFRVTAGPNGDDDAAMARLRPVVDWLGPIGVHDLEVGEGGADIHPLTSKGGILSIGLAQDLTNYWPIHHTRADTFDKIDPVLLGRNVAATAVAAYWLAESE